MADYQLKVALYIYFFIVRMDKMTWSLVARRDKHTCRYATGWPQPLNRGSCLIKVTHTVFTVRVEI